MIQINQVEDMNIYVTKYTVEWLVENTDVKTFNPVEFTGYQRQIDGKHVDKIIDYIVNNKFYFPTSIICSYNGNDAVENITKLYIVDGQHRVNAFKRIRDTDLCCYERIKNYEIPVVIMLNPDIVTEIETFITINKTSKKVDTSLAYVLRNQITHQDTNGLSNVARREYLAVEVARKLNSNDNYPLWNEKILLEGSIKNRYESITLNAFVRSLRALLGALDKSKVVSCDWDSSVTKDSLVERVDLISEIVEFIWECVFLKWPDLNSNNNEDSKIIQGAIGFTTINRYLIIRMKEFESITDKSYEAFISSSIDEINVPSEYWKKGGIYSKFTSESGYRAIVDDLLGSSLR